MNNKGNFSVLLFMAPVIAVVIGSYYVFHSDWHREVSNVDAQEGSTMQVTQEALELLEEKDATSEIQEVSPPFSDIPVVDEASTDIEKLDNTEAVEIEEVMEQLEQGFTTNPMVQAGYASFSKAGSIFFDAEGLTYQFILEEPTTQQAESEDDEPQDEEEAVKVFNLMTRFEGAQTITTVNGHEESSYNINYFLGDDPSQWQTNAKRYEYIRYQNIYPSIDVEYGHVDDHLKYQFIVLPEGDSSNIRIRFEGAEDIGIDENGDLLVFTPIGTYREQKPYIYQTLNGSEVVIDGGFEELEDGTVGFWIGEYDKSQTLVIDPIIYDPRISYSSYFGTANNDRTENLATDSDGNMYVPIEIRTGFTVPSVPGFDQTFNGNADYLIMKINGSTKDIEWATFVGGTGADVEPRVEVDDSGVYVVGRTQSGNFPTTVGAYQTTKGASQDISVVKLSSDGTSLLYSSFLGGDSQDRVFATNINGDGEVLITGNSNSSDFPTTAGAVQGALSGNRDAIVVRFDPAGNGAADLKASTYHGGTNLEEGNGIASDDEGNIYVIGNTRSGDYPTTVGAYDTTLGGSRDAFIASFSPDVTSRNYSSFFGTNGNEFGYDMDLESDNRLLVVGATNNNGFPVTGDAVQSTRAGSLDGFIILFDGENQELDYASYLGGSGQERAFGVFRGTSGNVYIGARTLSSNYPTTTLAFDTTYNGGEDLGLTVLNSSMTSIVYSTFFGGSANDDSEPGNILQRTGTDEVWVALTTTSSDPPINIDRYQSTYSGSDDALISGIIPIGKPYRMTFESEPTGIKEGTAFTLVVELRDVNDQIVTYDSTTSVKIELKNGNATTLIYGETTQQAQNGIVTFDNLAVPESGTYTITATNKILTEPSITTQSFQVSTPPSGTTNSGGSGSSSSSSSSKEELEEELHGSAETINEDELEEGIEIETITLDTEKGEAQEECERNESTPIPFEDIAGHWSEEVVAYWYRECVVNGKSQQEFGPDDTILQYELETIFGRASDFSENILQFTDETRGLPITRIDFLKALLLSKGVEIPDATTTFHDIAANNPNNAILAYAQRERIIEGYKEYIGGTQLVSESYRFPRLLGEGNQGEDVANLQKVMANFGYYKGPISGVYDALLADAVGRYQESNDIKPVGQMGPITRRAILNETIRTQVITVFREDQPITRAEALKLMKVCSERDQ